MADSVAAGATVVNLKNYDDITDTELASIALKTNTNLLILKLDYCSFLTLQGFRRIAELCPNIHTLSFFYTNNITDEWLQLIAQTYATTLTSINLTGCKSITDSGAQQLVTACTKLQHLNLSHCYALTNHSIKILPAQLPNLESLDISWLHSISMKYVKQLQKLRMLRVASCEKMTNSSLNKILQSNASTLATLDVSWCENLFSKGDECIEHMKSLRKLSLQGVPMSPDHVVKLSKFCLNLVDLDLSWNKKIDVESVKQAILQNKTTLKRMDLCHCKLITRPVCEQLAKEVDSPQLDILFT